MELDTGAPCTIMSKHELSKLKTHCKLKRSDRKFGSYTGHRINCISQLSVNVSVGTNSKQLSIYVVDSKFDTLLGLEWMSVFVNEIDFKQIFSDSPSIHQVSIDQDDRQKKTTGSNTFSLCRHIQRRIR